MSTQDHQMTKTPQHKKEVGKGKNSKRTESNVDSICWICFKLRAKLKCSNPHCDQLFHKQCLSQNEAYKLQSKVEWKCPDCQFNESCEKTGHRKMLISILRPESSVYQFISNTSTIQEKIPFGKFDSLMELILDVKTDIVSFFKKNGSDSTKRKIARGIFEKFQNELIHPQSIDDNQMEAFIQDVHTFTSKVKMLRNENERYRKDLGGVKRVLELTKVANSLLQTKYVALKREMEREQRKMKSSLNAITTETEHLKDQLNAALHEVAGLKANVKDLQGHKNALENEKHGYLIKAKTAFEEFNKLRNEKTVSAGNLEKIKTENISLKAELEEYRQKEVDFHNKNGRLLFELDLCRQNNKQILDYKKNLENDLKATKENNLKLEIKLAKHNNGHKIEQNQLNERDDIQSLPTASDQPPLEEEKKSVLVDLREKIKQLNAECDILRQERDEYREKWKNVAQAKAAIIEID